MNYFRKSNTLIWILIFLFILNLVASVTIYYEIRTDKKPKRERIHKKGHPHKIIKNELNLDEAQYEKFIALRKEYKQKTKPIFNQLKQEKIKMLEELALPAPDTLVLNNIAKEIGTLHQQLKKETIDNFLKLKRICTPEQQKNLNKLFCRMSTERHFKN